MWCVGKFFFCSTNTNRLFIIICKIEFMQVVVAPMARGTNFQVLLNHSHTWGYVIIVGNFRKFKCLEKSIASLNNKIHSSHLKTLFLLKPFAEFGLVDAGVR